MTRETKLGCYLGELYVMKRKLTCPRIWWYFWQFWTLQQVFLWYISKLKSTFYLGVSIWKLFLVDFFFVPVTSLLSVLHSSRMWIGISNDALGVETDWTRTLRQLSASPHASVFWCPAFPGLRSGLKLSHRFTLTQEIIFLKSEKLYRGTEFAEWQWVKNTARTLEANLQGESLMQKCELRICFQRWSKHRKHEAKD